MLFIIGTVTKKNVRAVRIYSDESDTFMDVTEQSLINAIHNNRIENAEVGTSNKITVYGGLNNYPSIDNGRCYSNKFVVMREVAPDLYRVVDINGKVEDMRLDGILSYGLEYFVNVRYEANKIVYNGTTKDMHRVKAFGDSAKQLSILAGLMGKKDVSRTVNGVEFTIDDSGISCKGKYDTVTFPRDATTVKMCRVYAKKVVIPKECKILTQGAFSGSRITELHIDTPYITDKAFVDAYIDRLVIGKGVIKVSSRALRGAKVKKVVIESRNTDTTDMELYGAVRQTLRNSR